MKRAPDLFTDLQKKRIDAAVGVAEVETSAEIVPVVATASGRYDRAEDVAGLWLGVLLMTLIWFVFPETHDEPGSWGSWPAWLELACLVAAVVVGFIVGAALTARVDWLRRLFAADREMQEEVRRRAREVFYDNRVHHTAGRGGVLIYVSLFERTAAVLADDAVLEKLGPAALVEVCDELTAKLAKGDVTEALCETVKVLGDRLAGLLPVAPDDVNEIPDALVTID